MADKSQFIGAGPIPEVDVAQLEEALGKMLGQPAQAGAPALAMFAQLQQNRAARMSAATKVLQKKLGKDDPRVIAAEAATRSVADFNARVETQRRRIDRWPVPRANEWMVFGTVVDAQGSPAAGLVVRVFDRDRRYDDLLGEAQTDELGDFSVIYHERDFTETREKLPELYVMVSDASGAVLYSSRDALRFESGRSEYFAIRLEEPQPARSPAARKTASPKASARGKST